MKSFAFFSVLFLFLLFASKIAARKDVGEYWKGVMKDQPMPESIRGLIHVDPALSISKEKTNCHTPENFEHKEEKPFVKDFEPGPNVSVYKDGIKLVDQEKTFVKDFEPGPNVSVYKDDIKEKSFVKDFDPRPNVSIYHDDDVGEKAFVNDFEPGPNVSVYHD